MTRLEWKVVLSSGALAFLATLAPLFFGLVYVGLDLTRVDLPFVCEFKRHLLEHQSGWLSHYLGNGEPLFANPQAQFFYPVRWLQAILPLSWGPTVGNAVHWGLAAAGTAFLALTFGIGAIEAFFAGMFFVFSGTVMNLGEHTTYIVGAAFLPWIWGGARSWLQSGRSHSLWIVAVGALGCLLGGEPQSYLIGLGFILLELLDGSFGPGRGRCWKQKRALLGILVVYALVFGVGWAQWGPSLSELEAARRGLAYSPSDALKWSFYPTELLGIFLPGLLSEMYPGFEGATWNPNPYLGLVLLVFALFGGTRRETRVAWIAAAIGLVLALGESLPVLPLMMKGLPPLAVFRYPAKYFILANLAICILGAVGLSRFRETGARDRLLKGVLCVALVVMAGILLLSQDSALKASLQTPLSFGALAAIFVFARSQLGRLLPYLITLDLVLIAPASLSLGPSIVEIASPLTGVQAPKEHGAPTFCFSKDFDHLSIATSEEKKSEWGVSFAMRAVALPNLNACDSLVSGTAYSVLITPVEREYNSAVTKGRAAAARALGCTHLVSMRAPAEGTAKPVEVHRLTDVGSQDVDSPKVFELDDPVPPAFVARNAHVFNGLQELYTGVSKSRSSAEILEWVERPGAAEAAPLPDGRGLREAKAEWEGPSRVVVRAEGTGGGVIGIRSVFAAGWKASQAGVPLEIVRVAGMFVAARVEDAARGPVEFEYFPPRLISGIAISLGSLVLLILLVARLPAPAIAAEAGTTAPSDTGGARDDSSSEAGR